MSCCFPFTTPLTLQVVFFFHVLLSFPLLPLASCFFPLLQLVCFFFHLLVSFLLLPLVFSLCSWFSFLLAFWWPASASVFVLAARFCCCTCCLSCLLWILSPAASWGRQILALSCFSCRHIFSPLPFTETLLLVLLLWCVRWIHGVGRYSLHCYSFGYSAGTNSLIKLLWRPRNSPVTVPSAQGQPEHWISHVSWTI